MLGYVSISKAQWPKLTRLTSLSTFKALHEITTFVVK